jgi:hypothetical protein
MTELRVLMAGLPDSGKTTYLAALYHLLRTHGDVPLALSLREEPSAYDYFREIERTWLDLERMERSRHSEPRDAQLQLRDGDVDVDVRIPDVSGESFNEMWEQGQWADSVQALTHEATGLLLFVRCDAVVSPDLIEVLDQEEEDHAVADTPPTLADQEWRIEEAPTQTKLADLVETVRGVNSTAPVAVAVAAWDVLSGTTMTPMQWFKNTLPLLWQTLESSADTSAFEVFGVSAQGGDVTDPASRDSLAAMVPPFRRILVAGQAQPHDLTVPLAWLAAAAPAR